MKFDFILYVERAEGTQTFRVDAESKQAALEGLRNGTLEYEMVSEDVEVTALSDIKYIAEDEITEAE